MIDSLLFNAIEGSDTSAIPDVALAALDQVSVAAVARVGFHRLAEAQPRHVHAHGAPRAHRARELSEPLDWGPLVVGVPCEGVVGQVDDVGVVCG